MTLHRHLILHDFITAQLGGDYDALIAALRGVDGGARPDGQSTCYAILESRASRLKLDLATLRRYDRNILNHEAAIGQHRPGFRLKYFQYLAALATEIYLDRLTTDPGQLLLDLDAYRAAHLPDLPPYSPAELRKLAFWMATGSGKTLVMHLNLRQFLHYRPFAPQNILLLTPSETLSRQHTDELLLSGIDVLPATAMTTGLDGVRVIEITKLYVENPAARGRKGGVSLPTSDFEGPNLLLVDEGHKGSATKDDLKTERAWRDIRDSLVGERGFTFEYSATFAQVTDGNDELFQEYSRAILFEYAYRRFHEDGFGKDYEFINLKDQRLYGDRLLIAGLLTTYEQRRVFDDGASDLAAYNPEPPLMIFVGAGVIRGTDTTDVVSLLGRVLADPAWATAEIAAILTGQSGLPGLDGRDAFAYRFLYLKQLGLTPGALYADFLRRLFHGAGELSLHLVRRADGEIGLRAAGSAEDRYCGVINVGEPAKLLKKIQDDPQITVVVGEDDHITPSLFAGIDSPGSPINLLIGSRKFIEGWSSWRVSVMGLLNVGTNAGAQVLQLFGRGVRLKGHRWGLKRAAELPGAHPPHLDLLERLTIFGLKANYLQEFFKTLRREDLAIPIPRIFPIRIDPSWTESGLRIVEPHPDYHAVRRVLSFDPTDLDVKIELSPSIVLGDADGTTSYSAKQSPQLLSPVTRDLLPYERLYQRALTHKSAQGWYNLYIGRDAIRRLFVSDARFAVPDDVLTPRDTDRLAELEHLAGTIVETAINRFYNRAQQRTTDDYHQLVMLSPDHRNFPQVMEDGSPVYAYQLKVPEGLLDEVDRILADEAERLRQDTAEPLPRLHTDTHLFQPLLIKGARVKSTPVGLEPSEVAFVTHLHEFWSTSYTAAAWTDFSIYLLRNQAKTGIGFFETAGFYPDFLLWLKRGDDQALAFVDPKGLVHWEEEKVSLLATIRGLNVGMPLLAFIATPTPLKDIQIPGLTSAEKPAYLAQRHVFSQEDPAYIRSMLEELRSRLLNWPSP